MSKNDTRVTDETEGFSGKEPDASAPDKPKRTKKPKEEATHVSTKLDGELRKKLLALNEAHCKTARYKLPLSATVALAIEIAHEAYFGKQE